MRELAIAILFVATGPASVWAQAGGASSPAAHPGETAGEDIAVLEAPVGNRQPGMGNLPPWLRQSEESGFERPESRHGGEPATHIRQRPERSGDPEQYKAPPVDIPPICQGC